MSSTGQAIGGVVGGILGAMVGNPMIGMQIGIMIGGLIDPPVVEGPRLDDLSQQTSTYGAFIPRMYGTVAMNGNILWVQGDALIERSREDNGKGGPTVINYEYFASFALSLCEGPIDGVRRIWVGGQLWYDAGSDDLGTIVASNEAAALFTLYLGTDTQLPDPLIQADRGAANVPAYRGLAYIVFNELPLDKYGNTLAGTQVKVEIVCDGITSSSVVALGSASTSLGPYYVAARGIFAYVVNNNSLTLEVFNMADPVNPLKMSSVATSGAPLAIAVDDEYAYVVSGVGVTLEIFDIRSPWQPVSVGSEDTPGNGANGVCIDGPYVYVTNQSTDELLVIDAHSKTNPFLVGAVSTDNSPRMAAALDGYVYVVNYSGETLQIFSTEYVVPTLAGSVACTGNPIAVAVVDQVAYVTNYIGNTLKTFDVSDPAAPVALGSIGTPLQPISVAAYGDYAYVVNYNNNSLYVYDVSNPSAPVNVSFASTGGVPISVAMFDSIISVACRTSNTLETYIFNGEKIASNMVGLDYVVETECLKSPLLTAADIDVTELTDQVRGYRVSSLAPIRGGIDPLRKAWPFDVVQHGYQIKFKARGGASVATIDEGELDAREAGASPGVQVSNTREMDTIIPDHLTIKYLDAAREYDLNVAEDTR